MTHILRKLIMECKFKQLWITSRFLMKDTLEEHFSCLSFELQPFTKQDQRNFLAKFWNNINVGRYDLDIFIVNLLEVTENSLNDKLGQFTEIPLQTFMLADVFSSEASNFCQSGEMKLDRKLDLLELYNRFVDRKFKIFFYEKGRLDEPVTNEVLLQLLEQEREKYEKDHMACAVHALLKTEDFNKLHFFSDVMSRVEDFQDRFRKAKEKGGIVAQIVNSTAMFTHRTFLEFFAAKWFTKYFKDEREYIEEILFREEFVIVREFFDRILAEGFKLHTAILNEDKDNVLELLSSPECDVNEKDKGGRTPLHLGVINHTESLDFSPNKVMCEILELLLQHHCDCRAEEGVFHWRPLTLADKLQAWSAVDMLLGSHAESSDMIFTMELIKGEVDNEYLCRVLKIVALQGYINIAKLMFKCGLCVNHPIKTYVNVNGYGRDVTATMLHIACSAGQMKLVEFLLEVEETQGFIKKRTLSWALPQLHLKTQKTAAFTVKERLETKDSDYKTPLSWVAYKGDLQMVSLLVEKGAYVNTEDSWKLTPLYYAVCGRHENIVKFLIKSGANVNACNKNVHSPISAAVNKDDVDIVRLLLDKGADVNVCTKDGDSLILYAVIGSNVEIVKLLLDKGANVNACKENGESPILAAVKGGNVDIVKLLLDKGADVNQCNNNDENLIFIAVERATNDVRLLKDIDGTFDVCYKDSSKPLSAALKRLHVSVFSFVKHLDLCYNNSKSPEETYVDIVRVLMDKAADVNACNKNGDSALSIAVGKGNLDILYILNKGSANV
ncbi:ankyrin-3-like [Periplaneta americana]|uniref:ankyrin-3-like n=1 Tax=Periplaneta americana TaxID=6978 RepID=UPI0037E78AC9